MINKVILVGRLTKDIELKKTNSNLLVVSFTLAVDRMKKEDGADFINCQAWKQTAEFLSKYTHKGSKVCVEGRISTRNYDGQNGKQYITEVVVDKVELMDAKKEETPQGEWEHKSNNPKINGEQIQPDELPFY